MQSYEYTLVRVKLAKLANPIEHISGLGSVTRVRRVSEKRFWIAVVRITLQHFFGFVEYD